MRFPRQHLFAAFTLLFISGCSVVTSNSASTPSSTPVVTVLNLQPYSNSSGATATYSSNGDIVESNHFFSALGANSRTCASCHQLSQGMSISAAGIAALFSSTNGTDPVFDAIDGANCPTAATGDSSSHSLMIQNGLVRIAITLPSTAQFKIVALTDPYGCAITTSSSGQQTVSVYRRPLPTSSLDYLSDIMWDTRETVAPLNSASTLDVNRTTDLTQQLLDAVSTHEQGTAAPTSAEISEMLAFEQGLFTAQATDALAGSLSSNGATGGPADLAAQNYYPGINDSLGGDPTGAKFSPAAMTLYTAWQGSSNAQQASIARGQGIFNNAPMNIANVTGLNSPSGAGPATIKGSCSFCHDTPNVGNRSLPLTMDTGVMHVASDEPNSAIVAALAQLSSPSLPIYQITGCKSSTGAPVTYFTTDPGVALFTGQCSDIDRVKIPVLRGLAARAPYFHNGSAATLSQVVAFYNARFQMGLSPAQQADLVNFLNAL